MTYLSRVWDTSQWASQKLMSSGTATENTMPPDAPEVEGKVKSCDRQVERQEEGTDKAECLEPMSKRQRKKLLKQKQWEEQKDLRRYGSQNGFFSIVCAGLL